MTWVVNSPCESLPIPRLTMSRSTISSAPPSSLAYRGHARRGLLGCPLLGIADGKGTLFAAVLQRQRREIVIRHRGFAGISGGRHTFDLDYVALDSGCRPHSRPRGNSGRCAVHDRSTCPSYHPARLWTGPAP